MVLSRRRSALAAVVAAAVATTFLLLSALPGSQSLLPSVPISETPQEMLLRLSDAARSSAQSAAAYAARRLLLPAEPSAGSWLSREDAPLINHGNRNSDNRENGGEHVAAARCPQDIRLDGAFALCTALDSHKDVKSYKDLKGHSNENGAYSKHNQKYDATDTGRWFIEEQYYGFLFIQAGLEFNNSDAIKVGMKIFNWGFEQIDEEGTFSCPDVYHSAGFFLESAARAALLLRLSPVGNQPRNRRWIRQATHHVAEMAAWFVRPDIERKGWKNDAIHTHRRYLTGTALGMAGILTDNRTLIQKSIKYIESGLEMQDPAGFNYERNGYDCSYQGIGLMYIARYYLYVAPHIQPSDFQSERPGSVARPAEFDYEIQSRLFQAGRRGAAWLVTRVGADGKLNSTGNTRTGHGQEVGRNGKPKALARKDVFHALLYWGWILDDPKVEQAAWLVERERTKRVRDRQCDCRGVIRWGRREKGVESGVSSE